MMKIIWIGIAVLLVWDFVLFIKEIRSEFDD